MEMSRLTRDGTAEPVSRDQFLLGATADREMFIFSVQLTTSRIGNLTRLIHTLSLSYMTKHTVVNPARGLLNREKRRRGKTSASPPLHVARTEERK